MDHHNSMCHFKKFYSFIKVVSFFFTFAFCSAQAQVTPSDVDAQPTGSGETDLAGAVGGESGNMGLQRPVQLGKLPFSTTFMLNSRLVRTDNMLKSEQDALVEASQVFEIGGTVSLSMSELTMFGKPVIPSLNLTHMAFYNQKKAETLDFETQIATFGLAIPLSDTLTLTPGIDYMRMLTPGWEEEKFSGKGASVMLMKMIPYGDKGMWMVMGGAKYNWTSGESYEPNTNLFQGKVENEQDRWDANLNLAYTYSYDSGIVVSPSIGVNSNHYVVSKNDGRHDYTYTAGITITKTFFEALNVGLFGAYSFKDTNEIGKSVLTQEYNNFDYGLSLGYSKSF
jgi:hypothetical protein